MSGDTSRLPLAARLGLQRLIALSAQATAAGGADLTLCLALSYGGREEIAAAAAAAAAAVAAGRLTAESLADPEVFRGFLPHAGGLLPDPDLLLRTSGELRVSNFLLWQVRRGERGVRGGVRRPGGCVCLCGGVTRIPRNDVCFTFAS